MADKKYIRFYFASMFKLAIYIICCGAIKGVCMRYAVHPLEMMIPSVAIFPVTWAFLEIIEGGRRSFFAKGYIVENIVPAGLWGIIAGSAGPILSIVFRHAAFTGLPNDFDIREPFYTVIGTDFFLGVVFFGYFFHILQHDFGMISAILASSVIYGCLNALGTEDFVLNAILAACPAVTAGIMIVRLGDVRSAVSFLCLSKLALIVISAMLTRTSSFEYVFAVPVASVICAVSMIYAMAKEKAENEKAREEAMELLKKKRKRKNG